MRNAWILSLVGTGVVSLAALAACDDGSGSGGAGGTTDTTTADATTSSMTTSSTTTSAAMSSSTGVSACPEPVTNITGECDLYTQDCPAGQSCAIFGDPNDPMNSISQCDNAGLVGLGLPCSPGECQEDMICVGTCTYACCPTTHEPCGIGMCNLEVTFTGTMNTVMACTYNEVCTIFDPTSCPDGKDCHLQMTALATCSVPSPTNYMDGDPCDNFANDCQDSMICIEEVPMDAMFTCRYLCQLGSSAMPGFGGCPGGQTCDTAVYDFGFDGMGFCHP